MFTVLYRPRLMTTATNRSVHIVFFGVNGYMMSIIFLFLCRFGLMTATTNTVGVLENLIVI